MNAMGIFRTGMRWGVPILLALLLGTAARAQVMVMAFDLFVAGVQVDTQNAKDVLEDGKVTYDDGTKTLTLRGATIVASGTREGILSNIDGLTVAFEGNCTVTSASRASIKFTKPATIRGASGARLRATSTEVIAIYHPQTALTIEGEGEVIAHGVNVGIGSEKQGQLTIRTILGGIVRATGRTDCSIEAESLSMSGTTITAPEHADFSTTDKMVEDVFSSEPVKSEVVIEPTPSILGTPITQQNRGNVLGDATVSYNFATKTLTLKGAKIAAKNMGKPPKVRGQIAISSRVQGLTIALEGENTITSTLATAISLGGATTIKGDKGSTLSVSSSGSGAILAPSLAIEGGCSVVATGKTFGISGSKDAPLRLSITGSPVRATGSNSGSFAMLESLTMEGVAIVAPVGATFSETAGGVALDDNLVKEEVVVSLAYTITLPSLAHGAIETSPASSAAEGVEVSILTHADEGYKLKEGSLKVFMTGDETSVVTVTEGKFVMPAYDVTIVAEFEATGSTPDPDPDPDPDPNPVASVELSWRVAVDGQTVTIMGAEGQCVELFNLAGTRLYRTERAVSNTLRIGVPQAGIYLVRMGNTSKKVVVQ